MTTTNLPGDDERDPVPKAPSAEAVRVLTADPPWPFEDDLPGPGRGAAKHYLCGEGNAGRAKGLSVEELCAFPLPPIARDAALFLWRVGSMQEEALRVARAWGFTDDGTPTGRLVTSELMWRKLRRCGKCRGAGWLQETSRRPAGPCDRCDARGWHPHMGMGRAVRYAHESCLIALRGRPRRTSKSTRSDFAALLPEEGGKIIHSRKPERFFRIVEGLYPGPYAELFARVRRDGWLQVGNELPEASS